MRGQARQRHRFLVRLPRQLVVGQPLEQPSGDSHLVIEVRQKAVFDRHANILAIASSRAIVLPRTQETTKQSIVRVFAFSWPIATLLVIGACNRSVPPPPPLVAQVSGSMEADVS